MPGRGGLLAANTGTLGEALAIAYLIRRGYEVFVGFGNTSCDLIAVRNGETLRVEVKTTIRPSRTKADGTRVYSCPSLRRPGTCDLLLWVLPAESRVLENPAGIALHVPA